MPFISSIKMKDTVYNLRASAIGSADVGSATKPVYLKAGKPTACGDSLGVSITGNAATANSAKQATYAHYLQLNGAFARTGVQSLQFYMTTGSEAGATTYNGPGWPKIKDEFYVLKMDKTGEHYNFCEIAKSSTSNSYLGYRMVVDDVSSDWIQIIDSSNFEKIIGTSYLKTGGGTMTGRISFPAESSGAYIEYDNEDFTFRNQSGALICDPLGVTLSSPAGEIKFDSTDMSITNTQHGTITITTSKNEGTLLNTSPIMTYGYSLKGYNAATTQTAFRIAGFSGNTIFFGNGTTSLDPSVRINASSIYANGTTLASTSDANLKTNINPFDSRYDTFFDNLSPVTFQYINGNQGRLHSGLLAQDVEEALVAAGLSNSDFAAVTTMQIEERETVLDEEGKEIDVKKSNINYLLDQGITEEKGLRYEEFIGLLIDQVQKLKKEVEELKAQLK